MALVMAFLVIYWRLFYPTSPITGHAIVAAAIFFLGAVQLFSIGILGEYIGRIYEEVKNRPLYTLSEIAGFKAFQPAPTYLNRQEVSRER
jgi:dolichol-phosphate mannosyltransferase